MPHARVQPRNELKGHPWRYSETAVQRAWLRARHGHVHQHLGWNPHGGRGDFLAYGHSGQYCTSTRPRGP